MNSNINIISSIIDWSKELEGWKAIVLKKILKKGELNDDDYLEILNFLDFNEIKNDKDEKVDYKKNTPYIPNVKLKSIKNIININALKSEQILSFNENGITVIYGFNGSGKSGYARVLKKYVSSRDTDFIIHGNYFKEIDEYKKPSAEIEIIVDGNETIETIHSDMESINLNIKFFDTKCSYHIIDKESDFSFVPYELSIFEIFSKSIDKLRNIYNEKIIKIDKENKFISEFNVQDYCYDFIKKINAKSDIKTIDSYLLGFDVAKNEAENYEKNLKENDPETKIKLLKGHFDAINSHKDKLLKIDQYIRKEDVEDLIKKSNNYFIAKKKIEDINLLKKLSDSILKGTGNQLWKDMYFKSQNFLLEGYGKELHMLSVDDKCPLCQQNLEENTIKRFNNFYDFLNNNYQIIFENEKKSFAEKGLMISKIQLNLELDKFLKEILAVYCPNYSDNLHVYLTDLDKYRKELLNKVKEENSCFNNIKPLCPSEILVLALENISKEIQNLEKILNPKEKIKILGFLSKFKTDEKIKKNRDLIINYIKSMQEIDKLTTIKSSFSTSFVTSKANSFVKNEIAQVINRSLNDNLIRLGVDKINISLESKGSKGEISHFFKINNTDKKTSPLEILSEGEQKSLAIASFLTESILSSIHNPIVFDDPVTSLDHERSLKVAKRLVEEGKHRQVIIFTHDLFFLKSLIDQCKKMNIEHKALFIDRNINTREYGIIKEGLPFSGMSLDGKINYLLNNQVAKLRKLDGEEYGKGAIDIYTELRKCWERLVEEVIFSGVINRFSTDIQTSKLKYIKFDDDDYFKISDAMTNCSNYAHDNADSINIVPPTIAELEKDILCLKDYIQHKKNQSKEVEKSRKC